MPFASEAQRRKFRELVAAGTMPQAEFDKWEAETGQAKLPERVKAAARTADPRAARRFPRRPLRK